MVHLTTFVNHIITVLMHKILLLLIIWKYSCLYNLKLSSRLNSVKYFRTSSRVKCSNRESTKVSRTISVLVVREMTARTEIVLEMRVYSPFDRLMRLLARECFVEFLFVKF